MLRITTSRNGESAVAYFTQALSKEDYYFEEKKVSSIWQGKTAAILGLEGKEVNQEDFTNLVNNIHPKKKTG